MRRYYVIALFLFLSHNASFPQVINKVPLSPRQTAYSIDARLDTESKTVTGSMQAFWVNMSKDTVPDIRLHLYMNAFRNSLSTFNQEAPGSEKFKDSENGGIDIKSFTDNSGNDLSQYMKFVSPDDGNTNDKTVLKVDLPEPAMPGDTVFINIDFETKLPSVIRRTGYSGDFYFVAQWFPKFGVYESKGMRYAEKGGWNCHQFHANSEFYSNHSLYKVKITLPEKYIAGSGGIELSEKPSEKYHGEKTIDYRAEDIVDFAWTAWPGYSVFTDHWKNITIKLLLPAERKEQAQRQFKAVKYALEYFDTNVGAYPWPYLTIVDPPSIGDGAGGMEYTTMFTSSSMYMVPSFLHLPEMVTIHEFGHAYFMGIMASNEFEEPWLDEGVNSFWEERILDHYYGENSGFIDFPYFKVADKSFGRINYVHSEGRQVVSNKEFSWNYPHGTYSMMSYNKTATCLHTLMGIIGEETTNQVFREYYKRWAFKYPSGRDFINVVNDVVTRTYGNKFGPDMNWFFEQTLYGTGLCDYKVTNIINTRTEPENSLKQDSGSNGKSAGKKQEFHSVVQLARSGEVMLPVDVLVHFNNGEEITESWNGKSRFKDFEYDGVRSVEWVKIDPDYKIRMDINFINNSMTVNPDRVPLRRLNNKLMTLLQFFLNFISL
jgi:hypothetical protein